MVFHQDGLSSGWSFIRVVSNQGLSLGWSLIRMVFPKSGLLSGWSVIRGSAVLYCPIFFSTRFFSFFLRPGVYSGHRVSVARQGLNSQYRTHHIRVQRFLRTCCQ